MTTAPMLKKRISISVWLRIGILLGLLFTGLAVARFTSLGDLLDKSHLVAVIADLRRLWWAPLFLIGLYNLLAVLGLPPGPLLVAGALFGPLYGAIYNIAGLCTAAASSYLVAALLGREFVVQLVGDRLQRVETLFESHGFWPLVQTRFLPLPFGLVNFGAALAGVRPGLFLTSAVAGLIPSTLIHTVFIAVLLESSGNQRLLFLGLYAAVFIIFNVVISALWLKGRHRRHLLGLTWLISFLKGLILHLDRFLRRKQGIFEYSDDPDCMFRVHVADNNRRLELPDGEIFLGTRVVELHFWNEHVATTLSIGGDVVQSVKMYKGCKESLTKLALALKSDPRLIDVRAVGGIMPLFSEDGRYPGDKVLMRLGFHVVPLRKNLGFWGRLGKQIHGWMMMWVFNPFTIKNRKLFRLHWVDCWMTTDKLVRKHIGVNKSRNG